MANFFKVKLGQVVFLFFFFVFSAFAVDPPGDPLYRADTRHPDDVFRTGFHPRGTNPSLLEHIEGATCVRSRTNRPLSTYVSLTTNLQVAEMWGARFMTQIGTFRPDTNGFIYIYEVRPTSNMYHVMRNLIERTDVNAPAALVAANRFYAEWVAQGHIPTEAIIGARRYRVFREGQNATGEGLEGVGAFIPNPHYDEVRYGHTTGDPNQYLPPSAMTRTSNLNQATWVCANSVRDAAARLGSCCSAAASFSTCGRSDSGSSQ